MDMRCSRSHTLSFWSFKPVLLSKTAFSLSFKLRLKCKLVACLQAQLNSGFLLRSQISFWQSFPISQLNNNGILFCERLQCMSTYFQCMFSSVSFINVTHQQYQHVYCWIRLYIALLSIQILANQAHCCVMFNGSKIETKIFLYKKNADCCL